MKLLFLFLCSLLSTSLWSASCCVSNTSVANLMILPARWQQTLSLAQTKVIGDADETGQSIFRRTGNKEETNLLKLDLAYGWTDQYQTGFSAKYQNRSREFNNSRDNNSDWSDLGLSHAYRTNLMERIWIFQSVNIPTASSIYNSQSNLGVDAHGSGTYISSIGLYGILNRKEWDFVLSPEVHHSFERTFYNNGSTTQVGSFWGGSLNVGTGYIPWRSKARYGLSLTPRFEGAKAVTIDDKKNNGNDSLVWDSSINYSYTFNAQYALGINYLDQTIFGPVRNTLLNRSVTFSFQSRWP